MKKKLFAMLLVSCLLGCSFMGCSTQKTEETTDTEATSETEETTEVEYKFFISELIDKYLK